METNIENGRLDIFIGSMFSGKCLKKGTKVICYNGSIKKVEELQNGEYLLGDNSEPRLISNYHSNNGKLYTIQPEEDFSDPFSVSENHILSLKLSKTIKEIKKDFLRKCIILKYIYNHEIYEKLFFWKEYGDQGVARLAIDIYLLNSKHNVKGDIIDISLIDYLQKSQEWKDLYKGFQTKVEFKEKEIYMNPYTVGLVINETTHNLPKNYLYNTKKIRLDFFNGIIKSMSKFTKNQYLIEENKIIYNEYIIFLDNEKLSSDIIFLARSLGFPCKKVNNVIYILYDFNKENFINFTVKKEEIGEYISFSVDGNNRFLLSDFTVTHNSSALLGKLIQLSEIGLSVLYINHSADNRSVEDFSTHSPILKDTKLNINTIKVGNLLELDLNNLNKYNVIGIDEAQFFGKELIDFVTELVDVKQKYVIVAGLDGDFKREKIGNVLDLIPLADNVNKLHAFCKKCLDSNKILKNALFSHFISENRDDVINIGGSEKYEPLCRKCYLNLK